MRSAPAAVKARFLRFQARCEKSRGSAEASCGQAPHSASNRPQPASKWHPPVKGFMSWSVQTTGNLFGRWLKNSRESSDPVKIQDIGFGELIEQRSAVLASVVTVITGALQRARYRALTVLDV